MPLTVRPLTPDLWPQLEDLFGAKGASNGCWCMYWRIGPAYARRPREENRRDFRRVVERSPPPGLIAFDGDLAVGWCQLTPRAALAHLDRGRIAGAAGDGGAVWSISCFYVRSKHRRRGVTAALVEAAIEIARASGASVLEAYPIDKTAPKGTSNAYTGVASTFARLRFHEIARRGPARVIMRLSLAQDVDSGPPSH